MHTENVVYINAPAAQIFTLASDIGTWPALLPHYRSVTVTEESADGLRKVAVMRAVRTDWPVKGVNFPVRWQCVQICEPERGVITFKHTAGVAQGMWVTWTLTPDPYGRGTRVVISHSLRYPFALFNGWFARELVGRQFVGAIAGRTLEAFKAMLEQDAD